MSQPPRTICGRAGAGGAIPPIPDPQVEREANPPARNMEKIPWQNGDKRTLSVVRPAADQVKRSQSVTERNGLRAAVRRTLRIVLARSGQQVDGNEFRTGGRPRRPPTQVPRQIARTPKTAQRRPHVTRKPTLASPLAPRRTEQVIRRMARVGQESHKRQSPVVMTGITRMWPSAVTWNRRSSPPASHQSRMCKRQTGRR